MSKREREKKRQDRREKRLRIQDRGALERRDTFTSWEGDRKEPGGVVTINRDGGDVSTKVNN